MSPPARLQHISVFMTITPIKCMCAMAKFRLRFTLALDREAEATYLTYYCEQNGIDPTNFANIGDGANDWAMLQAAAMGEAFEGKLLLLAELAIQLNHTDLRDRLYLYDDK